jgi:hypothetical protein
MWDVFLLLRVKGSVTYRFALKDFGPAHFVRNNTFLRLVYLKGKESAMTKAVYIIVFPKIIFFNFRVLIKDNKIVPLHDMKLYLWVEV